MRNFKFKSGAGLLFLASLFLASCGEQTELDQPEVTGGETVEVTKEIQINVLPIQSIGGTTRVAGDNKPEKGEAIGLTYGSDATTRVQTGSDAMTANESKINNAYIVQFNGTSPESTIAWVSGDIKSQLSSGSAITIPASFSMTEGIKNRVYVVANVASAPVTGTTLADFEAPVAYTVGTDLPTIGGSKCLPMSAMQDVGVGDAFEVFQLRSKLAKLKFTCTTAGATLTLKGVPSGYSFYTQPTGNNAIRPTGMTYSDAGVALVSGTTYYVPENLGGRNDLLIKHYTRCAGLAPDGNTMYVEITNSGTTYNLYLGDGSAEDFNFVGGYSYNIKATIYGTDTYDLRVGNNNAVTDLNADGQTANCYIATAANALYMFNSTVMGNGLTTISNAKSGTAADIIPSPLHPVNAEVLWETLNTTTAPTQGDIVTTYTLKDKILFKSGSKLGNALIAARDASNNIIWSWHIWRINFDPSKVLKTTLADIIAKEGTFDATGTNTLSRLVIMACNLGALTETAQSDGSCGLLYQWGRKDPFPGIVGMPTSTTTIPTAMATTPSGVPAKETGDNSASPAIAIQHPTTFYTGSAWTSRNDNLWGTPVTSRVIINNGVSDNTFNSNAGSKSIYDPCPVGWRVPPHYAFANAGYNINSGVFKDGYSFTTGFTTSGTVWFPAARYRNISGEFIHGSLSGYYWTSSPLSTATSNVGSLLITSEGVYPSINSNGNRTPGQSVRCVQE